MAIAETHRLPAEFERHRATWLAWPSRPDNWRCNAYFAQQDTIALASIIAAFEPVRLAAPPQLLQTIATRIPPNIALVPLEFNDTWLRDTGPSILVSNDRPSVAIDWRFNSWGGLFSESNLDDAVARSIATSEGIEAVRAPIVLEGGALMSNGANLALATEESILAESRNPGLSQREADDVLRRFLNVKKMIWLPQGLANDESGGHVDNLCSFAATDILLVASTDDTAHPSYHRLLEVARVLDKASTTDGRKLQIVPVPLPPPAVIEAWEAAGFEEANGTIARDAGTPLAPSHLNFTIVNDGVIVPTFNCASDIAATETIARAFPTRRVVSFDCREFVLGGGGVHCLTKEIPIH